MSSPAYTNVATDTDPCAKEHPDKGKYDGMVPSRSTTDILVLVMIVCMWIAMTIVGSQAIEGGDPYKLLAPLDDQGRACGYDSGVADLSRFYATMQNTLGVCVKECPATNAMSNSTDPNDYYCMSYVEELSPSNYARQIYISSYCMTNGNYDLSLDCGCNLKLRSESIFHRCIFKDKSVRELYTASFDKYSNQYFTQFIQDIYQSVNVIFFFGIAMTFVLCFIWCYLMHFRVVGMFLTWGSLGLVLCCMIAVCGLANQTAKNWEAEEPPQHEYRDIKSLQVLSIFMLIASIVFTCLMLSMRKSIDLAIETVALTARCVDDMPLIVLVPTVQMVGFFLFLMPWLVYIFYQASMGTFTKIYQVNPVTGVTYVAGKQYSIDDDVEERLWFLYFCLLWTMNFCAAFGSLVIAIACATWYFTPEADKKTKINDMTLIGAYGTALRYHVGTVAFGSLIIAIIQFVRSIVLYIEKHSKAAKENVIIKWAYKCVDCCLWCFEKCMKFINKNAYIQTAIHGSSFIFAAKNAFFTIARNILRIGAVHVVSGICLLIGKVSITCVSAALAYFYFQSEYGAELHGFVAPTFMVALMAYIIASMFMDVFEMGVDTLLMCYITDEENNGTAKYAEAAFSSFVGDKGKMQLSAADATADAKAVTAL